MIMIVIPITICAIMIVIPIMMFEDVTMAAPPDPPLTPDESLRILRRWNRWAEARLHSGVRRDIVTELEPFHHTPEIVALVGPRRAGKTTVLYQLMDALEASGVEQRAMLHLNLEEPVLAPSLGIDLLEHLYRTWRAELFPEGRAYLFLDEIQRIPGWERWVRARNESEDVKIFVTGSSAALMAPELATLLTGRHVTFRVLPLSFPEMLRFQQIEVPAQPRLAGEPAPILHALNGYLRWGGFPEVVLAENDRRRELLLQQYFDDILFKDVALRHQIRDLETLRNLAIFLLGQTASLTSLQRLMKIFGITLETARSYCRYLEDAFLLRFVSFYTLKTAERVRRPRKVYAVDLGLRNAVSLTGAPDRGRLMETAVHNALAGARNDGVFYWKGNGEVDLAERRGLGIVRLVQVVESGLERATTSERELGALAEARANFPDASALLVAGTLPQRFQLPEGLELRALWRFLVETG